MALRRSEKIILGICGVVIIGGFISIVVLMAFMSTIPTPKVEADATKPASPAVPAVPAVKTVLVPPKPAPSVSQLSIVAERGTTEHGFAKVNGLVRNLTGKSLENVTANVSWFDGNGEFIKSDDALIDYNPILPGQTSPFEVITTHNPEMKRFRTEFKFLFGGSIPTEDATRKK